MPIKRSLLNFTVVDFSILQHLQYLNQPVTRYKLMKQVFTSLGSSTISVPKFYRHVTRLHEEGLLELDISDENSKNEGFVSISSQGSKQLADFKKIFTQIGLNVLSIFGDELPEIVKFTNYQGGKVLFIDFPHLYDFQFLGFIEKISEELYFLTDETTFSSLKSALTDVHRVDYKDSIIQYSDNDFSLIICFFPTINKDFSIYPQLAQILKPGGSILLADNQNPSGYSSHYLLEILVKQYWPFDVSSKPDLSSIQDLILESFPNHTITEYSFKGLDFRLITDSRNTHF